MSMSDDFRGADLMSSLSTDNCGCPVSYGRDLVETFVIRAVQNLAVK